MEVELVSLDVLLKLEDKFELEPLMLDPVLLLLLLLLEPEWRGSLKWQFDPQIEVRKQFLLRNPDSSRL